MAAGDKGQGRLSAQAMRRALALGVAAARLDLWGIRAWFHRSPAAMWLSRKQPERLRIAPPDIRAADATIADDFHTGHFAVGGHAVIAAGGEQPFDMPDTHPDWRAAMHGFSWLRHLRAAGHDEAAAQARNLITDWLNGTSRNDPVAWNVETTARRVISWLSHAPMFLAGAEPELIERFNRSLMAQLTMLEAAGRGGPAGEPRLLAAIACAMAALCMPVKQARLERINKHLGTEIDKQVFRDGGHISRDPSAVSNLLLDLLPLRQTYLATSVDPPLRLMNAIERMMPMVRFFRHRDGTLARFNGTGASSTADLAT